MSIGAVLISVGFGFAMGWGLAVFLADSRPPLAALMTAFGTGAVVLVGSLGDSPEMVGGSLLLGSVAASATFGWRRSQATRP